MKLRHLFSLRISENNAKAADDCPLLLCQIMTQTTIKTKLDECGLCPKVPFIGNLNSQVY